MLLMPAFLVYELAQFVVVIQKGWLGEWWRAAVWMIQNSPHVLEQRRKVQKARCTPDRVLMTNGPIPFRDEIAAGPVARTGRRTLDAVLGLYWRGIARFV
jgi:hypothetical protein